MASIAVLQAVSNPIEYSVQQISLSILAGMLMTGTPQFAKSPAPRIVPSPPIAIIPSSPMYLNDPGGPSALFC